MVTGGNSGIGYELCKILYGSGATVYMATRSEVSTHKLRSPLSTNNQLKLRSNELRKLFKPSLDRRLRQREPSNSSTLIFMT